MSLSKLPAADQRAIQIVLFDLGDTLIYFDGAWPEVMAQSHQALLNALQDAGIHLQAEVFLPEFNQRLNAYYQQRESEFIQYTALYILRTMLAETGYPDLSENLLKSALAHMYSTFQPYSKLESDTLATLEVLRVHGYHLGLISNASDNDYIEALIDQAGIRPFFDIILNSAAAGMRKPHPGIFRKALDHWGANPQQAVMIGDTLGADILGARNSGLRSVWITRRADTPGNRDHLDTIVPDAAIASLAELPALLDAWNTAN